MQSTFCEVQATPFFLYPPSSRQIPCLSSCWLFVSIFSHLYFFFEGESKILWHLVELCTHTNTSLSYCMGAPCRLTVVFMFDFDVVVLLLWYPKRRRSDSRRHAYNVLRSWQSKYNKQREYIDTLALLQAYLLVELAVSTELDDGDDGIKYQKYMKKKERLDSDTTGWLFSQMIHAGTIHMECNNNS